MSQRPDSERERPDRTRSRRYTVTPWSEQRLYRPFVRAAILLGIVTGAGPGLAAITGNTPAGSWTSIVQAHGLASIFGWAGLFIVGIASHALPRFRGNAPIRSPWPQRISLTLITAAITLRIVGAWAPGDLGVVRGGLAAVSAASLVAAVVLVVWTLALPLRRGEPSRVPVERWIWAGLAFALLSATLDAAGVAWQSEDGTSAASLGEAAVGAGLFGFVTSFVFGMSLRTVAAFLGLRPRRERLERLAFAAVQAGVVMIVLGALRWPAVAGAGMVLFATGAVLFTFAIRLWERRDPPDTGGSRQTVYTRFAWFLIAGYGWLMVALAALVLGAVGGPDGWTVPVLARPALHTFALGFVSMVTFGFAARVLPLFEGRPLRHPALLDGAFVLLNAAVVLRLAGGIPSAVSREILSLSGFFALLALVCFAWVVWPRDGGTIPRGRG